MRSRSAREPETVIPEIGSPAPSQSSLIQPNRASRAKKFSTSRHPPGPLSGFSVEAQYDSLGWRTSLALRNGQGASLVSVASTYDPAGRLKTVTDGTNTATCTYLANSPLIGYITFTQSGTTNMMTTRHYDPVR